MACCKKKSEADLRSAAIDRELKEMNREERSEIKLLLLGPGDSGKSTLVKQLKILHTNGFSDIERQSYRPIIYSNIVFNIKSLCVAANTFGYKLQKAAKKSARNLVDSFFIFPEDEPLGEAIGADIVLVWHDEAIQQTFKRRTEFTLMDSAKYYFENLDRISKNDYIPSDEDVLRSRQRTRGIIETTYTHKNSKFRLVDVGGQRNERGKWIHCFEQVTAIIYCASLIEYNQTLEENPAVNRMTESLNLWEGICRYRWFNETAFILFLNKVDLFEEKILMVSLKVLFPEFVDSKDPKTQFENGREFIRNEYLSRKVLESRVVNAHFTCATDTKKINLVFDAVYEHLLAKRLADAYIM